jgi:hypothetical protein
MYQINDKSQHTCEDPGKEYVLSILLRVERGDYVNP